MWTCPKCRERVEDGFDVCWNCGTNREGREDPHFAPDTDVPVTETASRDTPIHAAEKSHEGRSVPVCSDCGGRMYAINLINSGAPGGNQELSYAAADSEQSWMLGRFPIFGKIRAELCSTCGRIQLFGVPQ
jgi:hypothetical protein